MKYALILVVVILFVRIDYIMGLFDSASERLASNQGGAEVSETIAPRDVIPVTKDLTLQKSKKDTFLALIEDFQVAPTAEIRNRAMSILKENPAMFTQVLDKSLENHIFQWRDLLNNNEPEVVNFLIELEGTLQGENLSMLKKFFSLWMDINMEHFIAAYVRSKDTACSIATVFGDKIPEEEIVNEYVERQDALTAFLAKEKVDPKQRQLATNCSLQLKIIIEKLAPAPLMPEPSESEPEASIPSP